MKTLYFDCFAGISGDMTIGALLHLGVDLSRLRDELRKLPVDGYDLSVRETKRAEIACLKFDVTIAGTLQQPSPTTGHGTPHEHHDHEHHEHHDHEHHDHHDHEHHHHHDHHEHHHHADHHHGDHRTVTEIHRIIDAAGLSPWVTEKAKAIFWRLAEAEGTVHGIAPDRVHFHEVGAVDAIVDVVGACIGFELLGIERFVASPLNVGHGFVTCAHGRYPIPAPGTAELLRGVPIYSIDIGGEFVTPTGAAIVSTLCTEYTRSPRLTPERIGYGAGGREYRDFPNALRLVLGTSEAPSAAPPDTVTVLEANIDDMNPQLYGHVMDRLFEAGALDVFFTPVQMKKNRPGTLLTVLSPPTLSETLATILFEETTTIGLRSYTAARRVLDRSTETVETEYGSVAVKLAKLDGRVVNLMPEYEDCRRLALAAGVPLAAVREAAIRESSRWPVVGGR